MAEFGIKWHLHKKVYFLKCLFKGNLKEKTLRKTIDLQGVLKNVVVWGGLHHTFFTLIVFILTV